MLCLLKKRELIFQPNVISLTFSPDDIYLDVSTRCGFRTAATSKMGHFVTIVYGFQPLTIVSKCSILDVAAVVDPPLSTNRCLF